MKTAGHSYLTDTVFKNWELSFKTQETPKTPLGKYMTPKSDNGPSWKPRLLGTDLFKGQGQGSYPTDTQ